MTARSELAVHRRRATVLDVTGAVFVVASLGFVVAGLVREGTPNVYAGVLLAAALALRAHAEVLRLRGVMHEMIERFRTGAEL